MICRLCGEDKLEEVINFGDNPITKYLLDKPDQQFDNYPIVLCSCKNCSFIQLRDCIPTEILYGQKVNLSSWKNQPHIPQILDIVFNLSGINHQSKILEIGCNDGSFLCKLFAHRYTNLTGIDPGCEELYTKEFRTIKDSFTAGCSLVGEKYDLVICRHTLEHISDLQDFGFALQSVCKMGTQLLIEVPNFDFFLRFSDYSGVWEEHVNYFTESSLKRYLSLFGIGILSTAFFNYSGQSLLATCKYTGCQPVQLRSTTDDIQTYKNNWPEYKKRLWIALEKCESKIAVYGAGCRSTSLINYTGISDLIYFVVDDQKEKQNKFLPGSRLPVFQPYNIYNGQIGTCLLAVNAENEEAVLKQHNNFSGKFYSLLPISNRILQI